MAPPTTSFGIKCPHPILVVVQILIMMLSRLSGPPPGLDIIKSVIAVFSITASTINSEE